jgi:streptogramin lyase
MAAAPNDWTIAIAYTGGDLSGPLLPAVDGAGNVWVPNGTSNPGKISMFSPSGTETTITGAGLSLPFSVAIDVDGNVWTANSGNSSISKHASNGSPLSGTSGFALPGPITPEAVAINSAGHVFVANNNNTVIELDASGSPTKSLVGGGLNIPYGIAIDSAQNVWTANRDGNTVSKFSSTGVPSSPNGLGGGGLSHPYWVAIDAGDNAWIGNFDSESVTKLDSTGIPMLGSPFATPAGVTALAVDGANSVWTANRNGSISHIANSGTPISPSSGYQATGSTLESGIVVDGSGNVWVTDLSNALFEFVGAGSPTVVPLQAAVKNGQIGQRP